MKKLMVLAIVAVAAVSFAAERPMDELVDGALKECFKRCFSPKTSLLYCSNVGAVEKASSFKNGLYDWYEGSKKGYGAGIGDCAISDAVALSGCVDRWAALKREGVAADDPRFAETADWAAKLAQGLLNLSSKHGYKGFVARGLCEEDGKSICSLSSIDQHTHWVHGLYRYSHSPMAKKEIVAEWKLRIAEVASRMERTVKPETDYNFGLCDGRKDPRGICRMWWPDSTNATSSCRLSSIYAAAYDATGERHWLELYERIADKACRDAAFMEKNKAENPKWKWITPTYTLLQMNVSLEVMLGCEKNAERRAWLLEGLRQSANEADFRAKDMWKNPKKKWYGMAPDAELALAQLTANNAPFDETALKIFEAKLREGDAAKWWSLKTTHMFAAYWRARLRGLTGPHQVSRPAVYPYYMNPRKHPDETRRTVRPPDRAQFGNRMQFTSLRHIPDNDTWRAELDKYVVSNHLGNLVWPNLSVLNNKNLPDVVAEIKRRGLWLFDVWGYLPSGTAQGVNGLWRMPDGVTEMLERELGDRWLGMDNGEQDGRWVGDAAPGVNRFDRMLSFQNYFEHMDRVMGNKMAALVSLNYGHYFLRENCYTMIGAETAQALPNSQVYYAFCRGAGKQYGVPWFGNVSIYNRWGWKTYSDKTGKDYGPTKGTSLALMKKLMYAQLFYNGLACGFEGSFFYGGFSGNGGLSPIGEIQKEAVEWIDRNGDPGVMQTPVALMIDSGRGWSFPWNLYGWPHVCWASVAFERGDFLTHGVLDMIYPGYTESGFFHDERGFNSPTPYGDIADCLLSDAPLWLLKEYPMIVLAGPLEPSLELSDTLAAYVAAGGHLVLTEGNRDLLFAKGLPVAANGGRVTLIPSDWGVTEKMQTKPHRRYQADKPYVCPHPLTDEARRILDKVLREQALFVTNPRFENDGLSVVTCRRGAGDYTLCVLNNTWSEKPLELTSRIGRIVKIEELATAGRERGAVGFLPEVISNAVLGADGPKSVAGGSTRMFRVKVEEAGVKVLDEVQPPANPKKRTLYLRSNEDIKVQLLRRPTFFRHFDSVMVDWKYVFNRDDEALKRERNWISLQGLEVLVDFRSGLNVYPDFRFTELIEEERVRSQAAFRKLLEKSALIGVRELVIAPHRTEGQGASAKDEMAKNMAGFARAAASHGIVVRVANSAWGLNSGDQYVAKCGEPNLRAAHLLGAWQYVFPDQLPERVRASNCDFWFIGLAVQSDIPPDPFFSYCGRLAQSKQKRLDQALAAILESGARIVFSADYPDIDSEYRDVRRLEAAGEAE